jgi:hypothetical protein
LPLSVLEERPASEGGGFTIFIPSMQCERNTGADELDFEENGALVSAGRAVGAAAGAGVRGLMGGLMDSMSGLLGASGMYAHPQYVHLHDLMLVEGIEDEAQLSQLLHALYINVDEETQQWDLIKPAEDLEEMIIDYEDYLRNQVLHENRIGLDVHLDLIEHRLTEGVSDRAHGDGIKGLKWNKARYMNSLKLHSPSVYDIEVESEKSKEAQARVSVESLFYQDEAPTLDILCLMAQREQGLYTHINGILADAYTKDRRISWENYYRIRAVRLKYGVGDSEMAHFLRRWFQDFKLNGLDIRDHDPPNGLAEPFVKRFLNAPQPLRRLERGKDSLLRLLTEQIKKQSWFEYITRPAADSKQAIRDRSLLAECTCDASKEACCCCFPPISSKAMSYSKQLHTSYFEAFKRTSVDDALSSLVSKLSVDDTKPFTMLDRARFIKAFVSWKLWQERAHQVQFTFEGMYEIVVWELRWWREKLPKLLRVLYAADEDQLDGAGGGGTGQIGRGLATSQLSRRVVTCLKTAFPSSVEEQADFCMQLKIDLASAMQVRVGCNDWSCNNWSRSSIQVLTVTVLLLSALGS